MTDEPKTHWKRPSKNYVYDKFKFGPLIDFSQPKDRAWAEQVLGKLVYESLLDTHCAKARARVVSVNRGTRSIMVQWVDENPEEP